MRARDILGKLCIFFTAASVLSLSPLAVAGLVNINTASESQLDVLPNIGPKRAQSIINHREQSGPFKTGEDIMKVHGIGKGIYGGLKDLITVGAGVEAHSKAAAKSTQPLSPKVYAGKKYIPRSCWNCKNNFYVPENLKEGWCPFCGNKWLIR